MTIDDWRARTCLAGHKIYPDGPTWCCNLRKGHDGPHDDGLGSQWTDEPERSDAIDQAILRGLVDRRIEVEGPDFDHADESLIAYAKSVRAALLDGADVREELGVRFTFDDGEANDCWLNDPAAINRAVAHPGRGLTATRIRRLHLTLAAETAEEQR